MTGSHSPPADTVRDDPRAEYARRREQRRAEAERYGRRSDAIGNVRLAVFLAGLLIAVLTLLLGLFSPLWLGPPVVLFVALVALHRGSARRRDRASQAAAFYEGGLRRLEGRWAGTGVTGERFADPGHPYSGDLDLFGSGSLFELLCTARTRSGEDCLASWLLAPATPVVIRSRQEAVAELRRRLDLREDLHVLGEVVRAGGETRARQDARALAAWGSAAPARPAPGLRAAAAGVAVGTAAAAVAWSLGLGPLPLLALLLLGQAFAAALRGRVREALSGVERSARDLALLSLLLGRIEREAFEAPLLRDLRAALEEGGPPPSRRIARLESLFGWLEAQHNQLFAPIGLALLWRTQFALAIAAWRAENGPRVAVWLDVVGQFEALSALAGHAYEHPGDPFPTVVEGEPVCFAAEGLGHPLLPEERSVRNDLSLGDAARLLIVSGSNMSGKSTLLRTVGVNAVLALAGAPVRARSLRLTPLCVGASLRAQDSLQGGISRFYAEITRLRQVVDLTGGPLPLLFLLDEILSGTNSHDRRVGAEAVVRSLVERGAVGLVTTHDLALTHIADTLAPRAANVHFEDHLENGKMTFDYRLRGGVVEKSNAIALMRAVGLDV